MISRRRPFKKKVVRWLRRNLVYLFLILSFMIGMPIGAIINYGYPSGKTCVEVYFEFAPYHDISYSYCFDDDTVYESRYYIGE